MRLTSATERVPMRPVGILGGMGPEATILLMQKCLAIVSQGAAGPLDDADHLPLIVHQNPQVPSRIMRLIEGQGADPAPVLAQMARDLAAAGAQALAMPCNTAHYYAGAIRAATALPLLDMVTATADHLAAQGARRPAMLASPAVRLTGVFDAAFAQRGLQPLWLADDAPLLALIKEVKSGGSPEVLAPRLTTLAEQGRAQGADHLLVACTELSLLTSALPASMPWTDSLDCLTAEIAAFGRGPASS